MTTKPKKVGKRDHAFDEDAIKAMGSVYDGGPNVIYEGVCPMCDDNDITLTQDNNLETPVQCACGAFIGFGLVDKIDADKTRYFHLVVWYDLVYPGYSQGHKVFDRRGGPHGNPG